MFLFLFEIDKGSRVAVLKGDAKPVFVKVFAASFASVVQRVDGVFVNGRVNGNRTLTHFFGNGNDAAILVLLVGVLKDGNRGGVGKKTAERIVIELKDKVNPIEALANSTIASTGAQRAVLRDAMLALTALGFSDDKARKMVSDVLETYPDVADTETVIKKALGGGK